MCKAFGNSFFIGAWYWKDLVKRSEVLSLFGAKYKLFRNKIYKNPFLIIIEQAINFSRLPISYSICMRQTPRLFYRQIVPVLVSI